MEYSLPACGRRRRLRLRCRRHTRLRWRWCRFRWRRRRFRWCRRRLGRLRVLPTVFRERLVRVVALHRDDVDRAARHMVPVDEDVERRRAVRGFVVRIHHERERHRTGDIRMVVDIVGVDERHRVRPTLHRRVLDDVTRRRTDVERRIRIEHESIRQLQFRRETIVEHIVRQCETERELHTFGRFDRLLRERRGRDLDRLRRLVVRRARR